MAPAPLYVVTINKTTTFFESQSGINQGVVRASVVDENGFSLRTALSSLGIAFLPALIPQAEETFALVSLNKKQEWGFNPGEAEPG